MITQGDDYPIHQTPEPVQQVFTSDRNFYDRFFFNGYFRQGEPYFAAAMGIYPNIGMIDCAFSVIVGGVQHCVRASRVLGVERLDTKVGPIAIEIVRPMQTLRVRVNHEAVQADLVFEARAPVIEEPRFTRRAGPKLMMDLTRFTQHGGYTGSLTVAGKTYDASPSRVWGSRDRSWGVRSVGPQDQAGPPAPAMPQFFWLWSPTNFEDTCTHFDVNENAERNSRGDRERSGDHRAGPARRRCFGRHEHERRGNRVTQGRARKLVGSPTDQCRRQRRRA